MEGPHHGSPPALDRLNPEEDWVARSMAAARQAVPKVSDQLAEGLTKVLRGQLQEPQTPAQLRELLKSLASANSDPE